MPTAIEVDTVLKKHLEITHVHKNQPDACRLRHAAPQWCAEHSLEVKMRGSMQN